MKFSFLFHITDNRKLSVLFVLSNNNMYFGARNRNARAVPHDVLLSCFLGKDVDDYFQHNFFPWSVWLASLQKSSWHYELLKLKLSQVTTEVNRFVLHPHPTRRNSPELAMPVLYAIQEVQLHVLVTVSFQTSATIVWTPKTCHQLFCILCPSFLWSFIKS